MTRQTPFGAADIRALIAAHPGDFTINDLVALLPTNPHDLTPRARYRRVANQVYPMLNGQERMAPMLAMADDGTLTVIRVQVPAQRVPEAEKQARRLERQRRYEKKRQAAARAATAARKAANPPKTPKRVAATQAIRPALPFNSAPLAPPTGPRRQDDRPVREVLPCTESFLRANPDKHEILPTFWSRP